MEPDKDLIDFDLDADAAEATEEIEREGTPTAARGREDDYWESGQNVLDDPPEAIDSEERGE